MKTIRSLIFAVISVASLYAPRDIFAQPGSSAPVTVAPGGTNAVPVQIKTLILSFAITRDKYLAQQDALLIKLANATTAAGRQAIRDQLQANRQAFMDELKAFRESLKDELQALKGKITAEEFVKIIDMAHEAATEGGIGHHKGH